MTLAIGEFIGALIVAFVFGGVFAVILWGADIRKAARQPSQPSRDIRADVARLKPIVEEAARQGFSRGCEATRATMRDDFSLLPRLHCSRSVSGHVRVSDVERMLAEGTRDG